MEKLEDSLDSNPSSLTGVQVQVLPDLPTIHLIESLMINLHALAAKAVRLTVSLFMWSIVIFFCGFLLIIPALLYLWGTEYWFFGFVSTVAMGFFMAAAVTETEWYVAHVSEPVFGDKNTRKDVDQVP
mgnify:CR=1 FL=1